MTAIILDILAVIFGVLIAPLCLIGVVRPKTRMGHLARIGAGTSIVLFFLIVWGNTGRDPLQWSYCYFARTAHACRGIEWDQLASSVPDARSAALPGPSASPTVETVANIQATETNSGSRSVTTSSSQSDGDVGGSKPFAPGLSLAAVKAVVPPDLQAPGFLSNGSGLDSTSNPIAIVQGLWASFNPGETVRPCQAPDAMHGNSVRGTALRYFQIYDGKFVGGGQQLIRRVNGNMLIMDDGTWGIRVINQDRIESVDFKDGSIGYTAVRCR